MFWPDGTLDEDLFQKQASLLYNQASKQADERERRVAQATPGSEDAVEAEVAELYQEEVPAMLRANMNKEQYNFLMRNQPYTQFVKHFFPGSVPDMVDKMFIKIDVNYKLPNEVINVLIHYLKSYDLSWNRPFVETIAADLLGKHVDTYEKAVLYIREQVKVKERRQAPAAPRSAGSRGGQGRTKPQIPVAEAPADAGLSDEAYLEILKKHQLDQREDA
jgi:replication initiation and membrane attachment protein